MKEGTDPQEVPERAHTTEWKWSGKDRNDLNFKPAEIGKQN